MSSGAAVEASMRLTIGGREIAVTYDPSLRRRGETHGAATDSPTVVLREHDERVLLHELLHVVLGNALPWFREQPNWTCFDGSMTDPDEQVTQWLEAFLWDAGYRRIDAQTAPTTDGAATEGNI